MQPPIYLDHHATTPVDGRVRDAMLPYLTEHFGNPASRTHVHGRQADHAVQVARQQVASLIGAFDLDEIHFTSGATESNFVALMGAIGSAPDGRDQIITSNVEHQSVLEALSTIEDRGYQIIRLPVGETGLVTAEQVAAAVTPRTLMVSIMLVQNVVGGVHPIADIGALTRRMGVLLHVDASQGVGLVPFHVDRMNIDLASLSAHKLYGPKGVGALYVRQQSRRWRPGTRWQRRGTLDVAGIVGLGKAAELMAQEGAAEAQRLASLRERLYQRLVASGVVVHLNGPEQQRHPGNLNVSIPALDSVGLAELRRRIAFSHGSACASTSGEASHVLLAMGRDDHLARTALRLGIGRFNTERNIDLAADQIIDVARSRVEDQARGDRPTMAVNCAGRRIILPDAGQISMCAIEHTSRLLDEAKEQCVPALSGLGKPPRISVIIPSHCSGPELGATLLSMIRQKHLFPCEITIFVNESPDAPAAVRQANDATERWLLGLMQGTLGGGAAFHEHDAPVRAALARAGDRVRLHCVRHALHGGLSAAYQMLASSFIRRMRICCDQMTDEIVDRRRLLEDMGRRTMIVFCDDDIELQGDDTLEKMYYQVTVHESVALGQWQVKRPPGDDPWDPVLMDIMQIFLDIKHELGATALPPRGILARHLLEGVTIEMGEPYADQLYFARIALERPRFTVPVQATIDEVDYPSNGRFLRDLRRYMQGEDVDAIRIFRNILELPRQEPASFTTEGLQRLIDVLESRDRVQIARTVKAWLGRRDATSVSHTG